MKKATLIDVSFMLRIPVGEKEWSDSDLSQILKQHILSRINNDEIVENITDQFYDNEMYQYDFDVDEYVVCDRPDPYSSTGYVVLIDNAGVRYTAEASKVQADDVDIDYSTIELEK